MDARKRERRADRVGEERARYSTDSESSSPASEEVWSKVVQVVVEVDRKLLDSLKDK